MTDATKLTQSADFRSVGANICRFRVTQWDIGLIFGSIKSVSQDTEPGSIELHTDVTLSLPAAKALAMFLALNIAAFEAENGTVKIPAAALNADVAHLAASPIADLIAEASRIQNAKLLEALNPSATTARPN